MLSEDDQSDPAAGASLVISDQIIGDYAVVTQGRTVRWIKNTVTNPRRAQLLG